MDEVSSRAAAGYVASRRLATGPMAAAKVSLLATMLGLAVMLGARA